MKLHKQIVVGELSFQSYSEILNTCFVSLDNGLGSISPNLILPYSISLNLFLIGGPTTTTCFVDFFFAYLTSFVLSFIIFFCTIFGPTAKL